MTDELYGGPKPMTIREAIEVMKIVSTYEAALIRSVNLRAFLRVLIAEASEENPVDMLRLLSLMYHGDMDAIVDEYKTKSGLDLIAGLAAGFVSNDITTLMQTALFLGIWEPKLNHAD